MKYRYLLKGAFEIRIFRLLQKGSIVYWGALSIAGVRPSVRLCPSHAPISKGYVLEL